MNEMNPVIEAMLTRRSIRKYKPDPVDPEAVKTILECGLYAPNGGALQMPRFIVIQNPDTMSRLNILIRDELAGRELIPGHMMSKGIKRARTANYHFIHHAPLLITAVCPREYTNAMADCAVALENMQLAAHALGIGSCWSNQPHWLTDVPEVRAVFEELGMKENENIYGSVSFGYADANPIAAPRKEGRVMTD